MLPGSVENGHRLNGDDNAANRGVSLNEVVLRGRYVQFAAVLFPVISGAVSSLVPCSVQLVS